MEFGLTGLLILGLLAACSNFLGGLLILPSGALQRSERFYKAVIALGAGFLMAVIFIEILPRTIELWQTLQTSQQSAEFSITPMLLLLAGYLLINFFEQLLIPHLHIQSHSNAVIPPSAAYAAIGGLLFHAFFDGVALAAAVSVNFTAGLLVLAAVFLHKLPEGFTVASLMLAAGQTARKAVLASAIVGLTTLLGVLLFSLLNTQINLSVAYVLPFAAGITLYVAASELIPELYHHGKQNKLVSIFVFVGVAVFFTLHYFVHQLIEG
jgi:zinc transporter ZupT